MGRPKKLTLDFFMHDANASSNLKIRVLENKFGNEGYSTYFKLLELLCQSDGMKLDASSAEYLEVLAVDFYLRDIQHLLNIIQSCADIGLFDKQLWESRRVIFSHDIVENNAAQINHKKRLLQVYEYGRHREHVYQRDGYQCVYCGATDLLSLDHIIPLSRGGSNTPENLATCCKPCNSSKGARTPEEWQGGAS